jgi:hypothetical protein
VEKENIFFWPKKTMDLGAGVARVLKTKKQKNKNKNTHIARDLHVKMRENLWFGGQKKTKQQF